MTHKTALVLKTIEFIPYVWSIFEINFWNSSVLLSFIIALWIPLIPDPPWCLNADAGLTPFDNGKNADKWLIFPRHSGIYLVQNKKQQQRRRYWWPKWQYALKTNLIQLYSHRHSVWCFWGKLVIFLEPLLLSDFWKCLKVQCCIYCICSK